MFANIVDSKGISAREVEIYMQASPPKVPQSTRQEAMARAERIRQGFAAISRMPAPAKSEGAVDARSVYFIQADNGLIKIGVAADPKSRLHTLSSMSPTHLSLIATIPGCGASGERNLHRRFDAYRSHGEWFHPAAELIDYIKGIA